MRLDDGKVYAMLGPNGSGKTTLMKMIAGLIKPTSGTITMDGKMLDTKSKAHIAYMPTESYFYPYMTVKDIVAFYKDFYKDFRNRYFTICWPGWDCSLAIRSRICQPACWPS